MLVEVERCNLNSREQESRNDHGDRDERLRQLASIFTELFFASRKTTDELRKDETH